MTDAQFTVVRFLVIPVALLFAVNWLALTSRLQISRATEETAIVSRGTFKGQPVAYLQTTAMGELRVPCGNAPQLCEPGVVPLKASVTVWLQKPGFLHDYWVVAAELDGQRIISPEGQAPHYTEAKVMWGLGTLASVVVAFVLWYFGPFKSTPRNEA